MSPFLSDQLFIFGLAQFFGLKRPDSSHAEVMFLHHLWRRLNVGR